MQFLSLLAIAGAATAQGVSKGFNYGICPTLLGSRQLVSTL
jgi:hypothetical protein